MKLKSFNLLLSLISILFYSCLNNTNVLLEVAPVFSNHMVLQQKSDIPIWGSGSPGRNIEIIASWGEVSKTNVSENGSWNISIRTPDYGGPYEVKVVSDKKEITFNDVMIGEVWLTSGQSNMEWPMWARILNQKEEIKNANFKNIRMFNVPRNLNGTNINNTSWEVATSENVVDFSAVGYFFAREIHQKLGVPVGILNSSWGGTRVEAWTSIEKLASMKESSKEANDILMQGGLETIKKNAIKLSEESRLKNENLLKEKSYSIPENIEDWYSLDLDDIHISDPNYNDSSWPEFIFDNKKNKYFTYESIYNRENLEGDGVLWIRKKFDIDDLNEDYKFISEGGIDDFDYTYLNGKLIGSELSCCTDRNYEIPIGLLKKSNNVLAIRIIDTGGESGFRGPLYLKSDKKRIELDKGSLKFKHTAFYLNTSIQKHSFSKDDLLKKGSILKNKIIKGLSTKNPNTYSILYKYMIEPIMPYKVKGFLWYQGESNVENFEDYQNLFSGMILDWREKWKEKLPFYFVQIAPYIYSAEAKSQGLRDAQRKTLSLENTGMAITLDIGEKNDIHPANKQDVGKRLARLALNNDYGMSEVLASGPLYKSKKLHKNFVDLTFDYVGSGLVSNGFLNGFEIAGSDNVFYPASAKIINEKVRVYSKKVKIPKRVRYGWKNYFDATLFNSEGLPASSFQTE